MSYLDNYDVPELGKGPLATAQHSDVHFQRGLVHVLNETHTISSK